MLVVRNMNRQNKGLNPRAKTLSISNMFPEAADAVFRLRDQTDMLTFGMNQNSLKKITQR